ncbi:MAG: hypothetical protein H6828_02270 [Planctomycetes bacterium]|nr:hypothetical protein [Planctomycetota bacterium]
MRALEREQPEAQRAAWTAGVVEGVVRDAARPELVRGAVLVGLARGVPAAMRDALLDAELRRVGGSGELLRATALAAALAGEESYCAEALDLGRFLALRTPGDERPRTFPLRLERLVPPHVSARLGAWLTDAAARLDELAEVQDEAAARELFASAELLFLLRGHRALLDAEVEGEVLRAAEPAPDERAPSRLYALRAASFLVHALAPCNDACFDAAARLGASDDPLLRALTDEVAGAAAPGLSVALQARLEALRYANERDGVGELMSALLALGAELEARAPAVDAQAVAYVAELALDPSVDPLARVTALRALQRAGDWTALRDAGARVLETESSQPLLVTALGSLAAGAGDDPARRAELRELLERRRAATSLAWLERALEQQLAALAD